MIFIEWVFNENSMKNDFKPSSRKIQAEERRIQILDTALKVFAEKGFTKTTIKDLAEAAGISAGLMYHYFPGKEKLLEAVVERHSFLSQLRESLKDTGENPCREVLRDISLKFFKLLRQKEMLINIFIKEGSSNARVKRVWSSMVHEGVALLQKYLSDSINRGELRQHNTEITARCLFSTLFMFHFTREVFISSQITEPQFIDGMLDNLLHSIQSTER
jgi:AcrR family transcriptional regulator